MIISPEDEIDEAPVAEFDEYDDGYLEALPVIGSCIALYQFDGKQL